MEGHSGRICSICLSEDGNTLYSASTDKTIKMWDVDATLQHWRNVCSKPCIGTLEGHGHTVTSLCFSFKTQRLISASLDKSIKVWDTTTNTCIQTVVDAHRQGVITLALVDHFDILYSASEDKTFRSWSLDHTWK
jgi:WD40 repeat protein